MHVGDWAIFAGFTGAHQFCRIGAHCITGIGSVCLQDVPPYVIAAGNRAVPHGINTKGLRRRDFDHHEIQTLKRIYKLVYRTGKPLREALRQIEKEFPDSKSAIAFADFLKKSDRGVIR